jgi:CxxC-x17-CxxC domain-containing protein
MNFSDRVLHCFQCDTEFVFTAAEQEFFREKGFVNDPKRCKRCMAKKPGSRYVVHCETSVSCAECGVQTTVPFLPKRGRPVLCRSCLQQQKRALSLAPEIATPFIIGVNLLGLCIEPMMALARYVPDFA